MVPRARHSLKPARIAIEPQISRSRKSSQLPLHIPAGKPTLTSSQNLDAPQDDVGFSATLSVWGFAEYFIAPVRQADPARIAFGMQTPVLLKRLSVIVLMHFNPSAQVHFANEGSPKPQCDPIAPESFGARTEKSRKASPSRPLEMALK